MERHSFDPIRLRPTVIDVDLDALEHNYRAIERHVAPASVMPVVKSNAYGHGMVPCALHLERLGAPALGVALLEEGIQLRLAGVKIPILVLGGILGSLATLGILHVIALSDLIPNAQFSLSLRLFFVGVVVTVFFGLFSGIYPAWRMSRMAPIVAIKGGEA